MEPPHENFNRKPPRIADFPPFPGSLACIMTAVISFCGFCLLLVLGKAARTAVPLLQCLYLPASALGYKQLFHEPFMGGGIWTSMTLPQVLPQDNLLVWLISAGMMVFRLVFRFLVQRRQKNG